MSSVKKYCKQSNYDVFMKLYKIQHLYLLYNLKKNCSSLKPAVLLLRVKPSKIKP